MATPSIIKEIAELNEKDLLSRIADAKTRYAKMKHMHSVTPLESPLAIKKLRRDIARMNHVLRNKQTNTTK